MPRQRLYESNAERQAAYNERLREKERIRQAAMRAEADRQRAMRKTAKETAGRIVALMLSRGSADLDRLGIAFGSTEEDAREMREYVRQVSQALLYNRPIP